MNPKIILRQTNIVELVFGAPATRQRSIFFVDEGIELL